MGQFRATPTGVIACKTLFIAVCAVLVFGGRHPPAKAQVAQYEGHSSVDVQASRVDDVISRLDKLDGRMDKQWSAVNANATAIAGSQGETRTLIALLGALQGGTFLFSRKSGGKSQKSSES